MPRTDSGSPEASAVIRTVGHGTRTTDELAGLLREAGVRTVIDVRRYPTGRRQPHLSTQRLAVDLPERGLAYEWWGEALGGRRRRPPGSEGAGESDASSGWRNPAFAAYAEHMATPEFGTALSAIEERARSGEAMALMCAETLWWRCHRRLIADALVRDGLAVEHLIDRVPGRRHRLLTGARS